jgi:hypothetical protein
VCQNELEESLLQVNTSYSSKLIGLTNLSTGIAYTQFVVVVCFMYVLSSSLIVS